MKLPPLPKDSRQTFGVVTAGALLVAYFFGWVVVLSPQAAKLAALKDARLLETEKARLLSKIQLFEGRIKEEKPHFSSSSDPSWLVGTISSMASETGVVIEGLTPDQPQLNGEFISLTLMVDARGDYHSLGRFLSRIESHPVYIKIALLKAEPRVIEVEGQPAGDGQVQMKMSLSVLYPVKGILK